MSAPALVNAAVFWSASIGAEDEAEEEEVPEEHVRQEGGDLSPKAADPEPGIRKPPLMQTKTRHGQGSREQSLGTPLIEEGVAPRWSRAAAPPQ